MTRPSLEHAVGCRWVGRIRRVSERDAAANKVALGRFGKPDHEGREQRAGDVDFVEALAGAREAAAKGGVSSGEHRSHPPAGDDASVDEPAAAAAQLSSALGAAPANDARTAAVEQLTELRASGAIGEEDFAREKRRILGYG